MTGREALIVASEPALRRHGLEPIARVLGAAASGVAPRVMGIGPVPATQKLAARLGLEVRGISTWSSSTRPSPPRPWPCCAASASGTMPST
jgi:acetyl-CoA acetyltransferase